MPTSVQRAFWVLLAIAATIFQGLAFVWSLRPRRTNMLDFFQEWASAKNYWEGLSLYTNQEITLERYLGQYRVNNTPFFIEYNAHPPMSVLLALPFAFLDYPDAMLAWNLLSLVAFAAAIWLTARELGVQLTVWSVFPAVALLLVCAPFREQVLQGQLNLFLLLMLVGAVALVRNGRPGWGGALVGVAAAVKLFPGLLLVYFAVRRQWWAFFAALGGAALVIGLSLLLFGPRDFIEYTEKGLPSAAACRCSWLNVSMPGFWAKLFGPSPDVLWYENARLAQAMTVVTAVGLLGVLVWLSWGRLSRDAEDLAWSSWTLAMVLLSPVTWNHGLLLLLVPVALLWLRLPSWGVGWWLFRVALVVLWLNPVWIYRPFIPGEWPRAIALPWQTLLVIQLPFYALLVLFGLEVWLLRREHRVVLSLAQI